MCLVIEATMPDSDDEDVEEQEEEPDEAEAWSMHEDEGCMRARCMNPQVESDNPCPDTSHDTSCAVRRGGQVAVGIPN
jgi:hypothetical protein